MRWLVSPDKLVPVVVAEPPHEPGQKHVSHEAELLTVLQASIADLDVASVRGQGAANHFGALNPLGAGGCGPRAAI
jgi:hypothetical protein